jgi:diacylglycerol kinase family enzyme
VAIVVFVNPGSRANRKDPGCAARFTKILGNLGQVVATHSLDHLAQEAARVTQLQPEIIGIHGGDGTLHKTLTALMIAYGEKPLPPIAILTGGTMNVVAASLGIRSRPEHFLETLVSSLQRQTPLPIIERRCLQVGDRYGFIFGNGLLANFLEEYYARGHYGVWRALGILLRGLVSLITTGRFARRLFRRFRGQLIVDGSPIFQTDLTGIGVATVTEVGFRMKLHHRADDDPTRMGGLAIFGGPLSLFLDILEVRLGRGISPRRAHSFIASQVRIEPYDAEGLFTMDGDLYPSQGPVTIQLGPMLRILKPES